MGTHTNRIESVQVSQMTSAPSELRFVLSLLAAECTPRAKTAGPWVGGQSAARLTPLRRGTADRPSCRLSAVINSSFLKKGYDFNKSP